LEDFYFFCLKVLADFASKSISVVEKRKKNPFNDSLIKKIAAKRYIKKIQGSSILCILNILSEHLCEILDFFTTILNARLIFLCYYE